jgi:hypothetical protein
MSDSIKLDGTTVNAPDALVLAKFYAEITNGVATGTSRWAAVTGSNGFIAFQQVDDFPPPEWPGKDSPMLMHLDFLVDDLAATGTQVIAAGATLLDFQPNSDHCFGSSSKALGGLTLGSASRWCSAPRPPTTARCALRRSWGSPRWSGSRSTAPSSGSACGPRSRRPVELVLDGAADPRRDRASRRLLHDGDPDV